MKKFIGKGKFIVFEGGEACGKSTQINLLKNEFSSKEFTFTREPGGTEIAEQIREIIITGSQDKLLPKTELALIYAARYEHLHKFILPNLDAGINVISDRFTLSSMVYQGIGQDLGSELINIFNNIFLADFIPDLTFIFDLEQEKAQIRINKRNNHNERFEKFPLEFHTKIREAYLNYAHNMQNTQIIDANQSIEDINEQLRTIILKLINN
jgi:dTMP kinase